MRYKLIAIDMDGTLLNSQNKVSEKNKEVLFKAIDEGIHVVLSTGRILSSALYYREKIGLKNPVIACNGALISSQKDIIYENPMNIDSVNKVVEIAEEDNIYYHFYDTNTFYSKETDNRYFKHYQFYEDSLKKQSINLQLFKTPIGIFGEKKPTVYKFVFVEENTDKLLKFREKLSSIDGINVSSSWHNNIEVMNEGVSKGTGLEHLIGKLNIDKSQVVAIGDNENDISMFKTAGLAIGMKNGAQNIKDCVHVVTDTNDQNGVGKAIEKYVLNK
ncbi:Cof-type HAD-IIB family hydrolase [Schnuerera sp.]|uniref:Cof-type HAD-IIB family hydrolase n=1 Tax=Schnuerera sp. TaxID=2794844 RepID=UPI002C275F8A|nr:Cof-type HAD-IIB family hydrolase [Schnuerera sp.]HSH35755.1 Cof-type HAD-IIB family hydrolase [Schnuerera sp.]